MPRCPDDLKLDFTAEEWLQLVNRKGDVLPPCCVEVSNLRDDLADTICDGGYIQFWKAQRMMEDYSDFSFDHSPTHLLLNRFFSQVSNYVKENNHEV